MRNMQTNTTKLVTLALMTAISVILVYLIHFPIFPGAPFLEYDPADIPIFITTFVYGPLAGIILTIVTAVIQGFTVSIQSGIIGVCMHIFATGSFVLVAGSIYKYHKTRKVAVFALLAGVLVMSISMALWNILVTPLYLGTPRDAVMAMILPIIIPFNLIKAGFNSLITFILYKSIAKLLIKS